MKTWLTRNRRRFLALGIVAAALAVFALGWYAGASASTQKAYAALWEAIVDLPDPEQCALCAEERRYQAPCLIDLSTGEMGEMQVYTYGPTKQGKLDPREAQFSGTFSLRRCAGLTAFRDTDFHTCEVTLPAEKALFNPALYCKECRQLLAGGGFEGYAILDL